MACVERLGYRGADSSWLDLAAGRVADVPLALQSESAHSDEVRVTGDRRRRMRPPPGDPAERRAGTAGGYGGFDYGR